MEQTPPLNQVIAVWLADFSHFICDRLSLPQNQVEELFQEYLNLTAKGPSQQPVALPCEQSTSCPEPPNPYHTTHNREQPPTLQPSTRLQTLSLIHSQGFTSHNQACSRDQPTSSYPPAQFQTLPLDYSKAPNSYHESHDGEEPANPSHAMALTAPHTARQGPSPLSDLQSSGVVPTNGDVSETGTLPPQPNPPANPTPIGSITEYDPLWVQHNNEDPAAVEGFPSAMSFYTLLSAGVIKIGDVLTFQVTVPAQGQPLDTEAHLSIIGMSPTVSRNGKFPDLHVTLLSNPNMQVPVAKACTGTTAMIQHLQTCNITASSSHWRDIQVFRGQQVLGSLWWVKQAFHFWRDRKDQEARETGQHFRQRRANKKDLKHVKCFKGVFGVWQHGQFMPDPDQARFRATG